jgi:cyclopentanol dehydrogenase
MSERLADKVSLITGAARGQGAAEARLFAEEGSTVIVTDVLEEEGQATADEIKENGGDAEFRPLDVTDEAAWESLVTEIIDEYGRIDVLVNNAGVLTMTPVHELSVEEWQQVIDVDQKGVFLGMKHVIPTMIENGGGSIVNTSSIWGVVGAEGAAAYQAAKGAVRNMTKNAAITYAGTGVRVNSIHPGIIDTPMVDGMQEVVDAVVEQTPVDRAGTPEEVARGALFLASDESSFVTGEELFIDGGLLAQ